MRRRLGITVGIGALALFLSSCFMVQGFVVLDYTLTPGQPTKARFIMRPSNFENELGPPFTGAQYQFVLVGVATDSDLAVLQAKWGANGKFGGPLTMAVSGGLLGAIGSGCGSFGLDPTDVTGITWKGFITPIKIGDRNAFEQSANVEVGVKAKAVATVGDEWQVLGIAGTWWDDGDDTLDGGDIFGCTGIESATVHIRAA